MALKLTCHLHYTVLCRRDLLRLTELGAAEGGNLVARGNMNFLEDFIGGTVRVKSLQVSEVAVLADLKSDFLLPNRNHSL